VGPSIHIRIKSSGSGTMTIIDGLRKSLLNKAGFATRVYYMRAPAAVSKPYCVIRRIGEDRIKDMAGLEGNEMPIIEVAMFASSQAAAKVCADTLNTTYNDNYKATWNDANNAYSMYVQNIDIISEVETTAFEMSTESTQTFSVAQDWRITHNAQAAIP